MLFPKVRVTHRAESYMKQCVINLLAGVEIRATSQKLPKRFAVLPIGKYQKLSA